MASTSETGLQLFARLNPRPSLVELDSVLFPGGPNPKEVVELCGESSCGKTLLFSQFIVKCILPKEWQNEQIGGLKTGVVLLNTDHHFHLYKLISLMESHIRTVNTSFSLADVENIVKDALARLIIYNIVDSVQLQVTFYGLQAVVSNQPDVGLILLDSVCAFYWQDTLQGGIKKMDLYAKTVVKTLQRVLGDFKGVIMYTRPHYFQSKSKKAELLSSETGSGNVNRRITLKLMLPVQDNKHVFYAEVEGPSVRFTKFFNIDSAGVHWIEDC